jgi:transposase
MKLHIVSLTKRDNEELSALLNAGSHPAVVIQRAQILLKADRQLKDKVIAEHLDCTREHVARIRQRYCKYGLKRALFDMPRSGRPVIFREKEKAGIIALACTQAPKGYSHWTLDLLVEEAEKKEKIKMGRTKVWTIMQENELKPWREKNVVHSKIDQ